MGEKIMLNTYFYQFSACISTGKFKTIKE